SGLLVIDVSNPNSPQIKGSVATPGWANGIAMSGSIAYVCAGSALLAVDVSNPLSPTIVGNQDTPAPPLMLSCLDR
ncbi:MAG TPA: hypothetical protein VFP10_07950, partial [Candidatus Eisenbacteria bacterium]|nr:hypothetical protein [Candidatus Eisenbacteria bacterium]